jgi:uncharacterized membrane protein HdeD (DUF308 family)
MEVIVVEESKPKKGMWLIPHNPWAVLFQGLGILAFGVVLLGWPEATTKVVLIAFGVFALAFGAFQAYDAFSESRESRWWKIPLALISIIVGFIALVWPGATERIALIIVGLWFILTGLILMAAGLKLPKEISGKWAVVVISVIALGFGLYLLLRPQDTTPDQVASVVVRLIGIFSIVEGLLMASYSFMLRKAIKILEAGQ